MFKTEKGELYSVEECKLCENGIISSPSNKSGRATSWLCDCKDGTITHKVKIKEPKLKKTCRENHYAVDSDMCGDCLRDYWSRQEVYEKQFQLKEQLIEACKVEKPKGKIPQPPIPKEFVEAYNNYLEAEEFQSQYKHNLKDKAHPIQLITKT